ncbi:MAG: hypothetical protein C0501_02040 [Isosphaera sp.]|nr:hypothetical protein [Isosphaera sp.]
MKSVLRQLDRWRSRERVVLLLWGAARLVAVAGTVLAFACLVDWVFDRYSGSEWWRRQMRRTRVFAPSDPLSVGETPFGLRVLMTFGQLALAGFLAYLLLVRPWRRTPPVDDFASRAEQAFPVFDHRLVTALQLNRPTADTRGMSQPLIREVTREAGEIAADHDVMALVEYRRAGYAAAVLVPVLLLWGLFLAVNPGLAGVLLKRQALLPAEIPRRTQLADRTAPVHPTGTEVVVRFEASGEYSPSATGTLRVVPISSRPVLKNGSQATDQDGNPVFEDEPEEYYTLTNEPDADGNPTAFFSVKLPPASLDFKYQARLGDGRTREPGRVRFEAPPQLGADDPRDPPLTAEQVLPDFLGRVPDGPRKGQPFVRRAGGWDRGEVVDALPGSKVIVDARFNKPVRAAKLVPIERVPTKRPGVTEERARDPIDPGEIDPNRKRAAFVFPATPRTVGYRLLLEDDLGFRNPVEIRRNVRMWEDRPPAVEFKPESTRNPDPAVVDGQGNPKDYEWDMALTADGLIQVVFAARSEVGVRAANIRYRVIPRGVDFAAYPKKKLPDGTEAPIDHPAKDPELLIFDRLPLTRFSRDPKEKDPPPFVPELGLFLDSFRGVPRPDRNKVNVEFYPLPSRNPRDEPGELGAGGRRNFEVSGLLKKVPERVGDRTVLVNRPIEIGDTVEVYVEVFDKLPGPDGKPDPDRPAGYTKTAVRKIVVTEADAYAALKARDEAKQKLQDKLRQIADDQADVFRPKN